MLSSPGYVIQKAVQKVNYNMGRVYKEAGLGKLRPTSNINVL